MIIDKEYRYTYKQCINTNHYHDNIISEYQIRIGRQRMTQIIAAKANKGIEIILISDRMVTRGDNILRFEHDTKMDRLGDFISVLSTGSIHEPEIIEDAKKEITGHMGVRKISEIVANKYGSVRRKRIENTVLAKYGLTSFDDCDLPPRLAAAALRIRPLYKHTPWAFCDSM
ncbi:MAG: hypothetical protein JW901_08835, partial [Dehalococcoidia bacterium]|nr:hypothetical protein [Dehalococcoidia bacterium]